MIRIRRIPQRIPVGRLYEVEVQPAGSQETHRRRTRSPVAILEPLLGIGDAWSFVDAADEEWSRGNRRWAVEFEDEPAALDK